MDVAMWFCVFFALAQAGAQPSAVAPKLSAVSSPPRPFIEQTAAGVAINGDIVVRNNGDEAVELVKIRMDALDSSGALIQRRELNRNGISPSILTVPDRRIDKNSSLLIYNPFPLFDRPLPVARLHYELSFKPVDGEGVAMTTVDVIPARPPSSGYIFPLTGRFLVWDGHDFYSHHRRWNYLHPLLQKLGYTGNAGRYAFDFIAVDEYGARARGDEHVNENWPSFGQLIRATDDGIVEAVRGDAKDDRKFNWGSSKDPNGVFGNYIVLRHSDGTFSIFGHLMRGSPRVRQGERVRAGQLLARVGASGDSLFPHLHYQRTLEPNDLGEGAPVSWRRVKRAVGKRLSPLASGYIDSGDVVVGR
jgi:hypothetical protein